MTTEPNAQFVAEASYPATYREREVGAVVRAVQSGYSILVCGPGGCGKSHLLRFLAYHPTLGEAPGGAGPAALPGRPGLLRLYLDCNAAIADDAAGVFRALLLQTGADAPTTYAAPDILQSLRTSLAGRMAPGSRLLVILDRWDRVPEAAQPAILDGLRHLRDYLGRRVSYVLGCRRPPPIAELSEEFDDLLAAPPVVWIGPLSPADAAWNCAAIGREVGAEPDEMARQQLWELSGGHARLLRVATLAWAPHAPAAPSSVAGELLDDRQVLRALDGLVRELERNTLALLRQLARGEQVELPARHALRLYGLVHDVDGRPRVTGELPRVYCANLKAAPALDLTALEQRLWELLQDQPEVVHRRDDLVMALYGDNPDGINDEALTALVARLRRKLHTAGLGTIDAQRGLGYRFMPADDTTAQQ